MPYDYKKREQEVRERNAKLSANGYIWKKREIQGNFDPDDPKYETYLVAPDGVEVSVAQAIDEIDRGRDVVRAEIAADLAAKAEQYRLAAIRRATVKQREYESLQAVEGEIARVRETMTKIDTPPDVEVWTPVVVAEVAGKNRVNDGVWRATVNSVLYVKIVAGSYQGDEIYPEYYTHG